MVTVNAALCGGIQAADVAVQNASSMSGDVRPCRKNGMSLFEGWNVAMLTSATCNYNTIYSLNLIAFVQMVLHLIWSDFEKTLSIYVNRTSKYL